MDNKIQDRISLIIDSVCGGNKSEFTRRIGKDNSAVKDIIGGKKNAPSYNLLYSIVNSTLGISPKWLITGEGSMLNENYDDGPRFSKTGGELGVKELPILPFSAVAGALSENIPSGFLGQAETCKVSDFIARGADCCIRVDGDSMYPRYSNGEILAIRVIHDPTFFQWGKVYCLSTNQGCVIKKLFPDDDPNYIICHSENTANYPDYKIAKSDVLGVAVVVGHIGIE